MPNTFRNSSIVGLVFALCLLAMTEPGPAAAAPMTFVVSTYEDLGFTNCDPGDCSLRGAITAANSHAGPDTIIFDPAAFPTNGNALPIVLSSLGPGLPAIDAGSGVTIDGSG